MRLSAYENCYKYVYFWYWTLFEWYYGSKIFTYKKGVLFCGSPGTSLPNYLLSIIPSEKWVDGWCVSHGKDQNSGVISLGNKSSRDECKDTCLRENPGGTACEYNKDNGYCSGHTEHVSAGHDGHGHLCMVL